jgi:hypothetical protein
VDVQDLAPWLRDRGRVAEKKWSGIGKELFTDADNFGIDLSNVSEPQLRALLFSATVLIDGTSSARSSSVLARGCRLER